MDGDPDRVPTGVAPKYLNPLPRPIPMVITNVSRDFDTLSAVYDETRQPLDPATIHGLHEFLHEHQWNAVLEVGVGTGRVARPLLDLGVHVVGVDASRGMLGRASAKHLPYLVRGNAYRLPFRPAAFDVCLFVHVLHILDRPDAGLEEAARVSRHGALAVLDLPPKGSSVDRPPEQEPRRIVRELLTGAGYPDLLRSGPRAKEQEILRTHPPVEVRVLSDREITEPLSKGLNLIEKRAYRQLLRVPSDVLERAVAVARETLGDRTVTYQRVEAVAWWPPPTEPSSAREG